MKQLTRDEIFAIDDLKTELVPVPEWGDGVGVRVRAFSLAQRDLYLAPTRDLPEDAPRPTSGELAARLVVHTTVDANGAMLFTDADIPKLLAKSRAAIDRIAEVAQRLNGFGPVAVKDAEKNSAASPN